MKNLYSLGALTFQASLVPSRVVCPWNMAEDNSHGYLSLQCFNHDLPPRRPGELHGAESRAIPTSKLCAHMWVC
jgi:hypothetical protein